MLVFTNRILEPGPDEAAFTRRFMPGAGTLGLAEVQRAGGGWALGAVTPQLSDDAALAALVALFQGPARVLVYLHGNNNTPAACFERCTRLQEIYGLQVLGFSWTSEGYLSSGDDLPNIDAGGAPDAGEESLAEVRADNRGEGPIQRKLRRYRQAKVNAQESVEALGRFLRLVATARLYANAQPFTLAAHSLGAHLLQYTLEVEGATEALGAAYNVVLLAACVRAAGHADWLARIHPKGQVFVTYHPRDTVLYGAFLADGQQLKLGADPGAERLHAPGLRYISFENGEVNAFAHGYFVAPAGKKMRKRPRELFERLFGSKRDLEAGQPPRDLYPAGCDPDGSTCYMGQPAPDPVLEGD